MDQNTVLITDVGTGTWRYLWRHWPVTVGFVILAAAALTVGIMIGSIILLFIGIAVLVSGYSIARGKVQDEFMRQFATANGYAFSPKGNVATMTGVLFSIGDGRQVSDVVSGTYRNYPIELFLYQYTIGNGKNSQTFAYTVFKIQCDAAMPDIVLEQKDGFRGESLIKNAAKPNEIVSLEGDFNNYFTLSVPKGYEVEALEVFTPDVMAQLIDRCKSFSLEIVGNNVFIYSSGVVSTEITLQNFYSIAQYFAEELGPVLARMKPALVAENV